MITMEKVELINRISDPNLNPEERKQLLKLHLSNHIIRTKRLIRQLITLNESISNSKQRIVNHLKQELNKITKNKITIDLLKHQIRMQNEMLVKQNILLAEIGNDLYNVLPLFESVASLHDFIQIINGNMRNVEKKISKDGKQNYASIERTSFVDLIFQHCAERRETKQKTNVLNTYSDRIQMPLREAIEEMHVRESNVKNFKLIRKETLSELYQQIIVDGTL